jgi:hypothetical protein
VEEEEEEEEGQGLQAEPPQVDIQKHLHPSQHQQEQIPRQH